MNIVDYSSNVKAIPTTGGTVTFTNQEIPSTKLSALHFATTGVGNSLASINRVRVKANGQAFIDTTPTFLRAWMQAITRGRIRYPASNYADANGAGTMAENRRFSIPFCDLSKVTREEQDLCGFPRNANITVELVFNTGLNAGNVICAFTQSTVDAVFYHKLISQQMDIAASSVNRRFAFSDDGVIKGLGLNTIGLSRLRVVLAGMQVFHSAGQQTASATLVNDSLAVEAEQLFNAQTDIANATAGVPQVLYNPFLFQMNQMLLAPSGNTFVELATDANWAGVANELLVYSQVPQG